MRKIKIFLFSLVGLISAFITILAFILISYTHQDYQHLLIKSVDTLSDYTLSITGPIELDLSSSPVLSASGIKLYSKTDDSYVHIDNFRVQVSLSPLLNNTLLINDLLLENMRVEMQTSEDSKSFDHLFSYLPVPIVEHAVLKNIHLTFDNQSYSLDSLEIAENDKQDQLEIQAEGKISTRPFNINGFISLLSDTNDFYKFSPDSIAKLISGNKTKARFKGDSAIGQTRISAELVLSFINGKPEITGEITSPDLFLKDFGIINTEGARKTSSQKQDVKPVKMPLFSHQPISLQALHKVDLNLQLKIHKLSDAKYKLNKIDIAVQLKNGKFSINPLSFNFFGEHVLITAEIDARVKPGWELNIDATNIQVTEILGKKHSSQPVTGKLSLVAELKGSGISMYEIASSLNGEVSFVLENGKINRRELELIFLNPLGWLFTHGIADNKTLISCGLAHYYIKQGIIRSKVLLIDGPKLFIRGIEEINLARETINSLYNLDKKNFFESTLLPVFLHNSVPIRVTGNLAAPLVEQAPISSVRSNAERYIFAPITAIPNELIGTAFGFFGRKKETESPCKAYLGQ
jgi:autotransporter translocation and assembly factor TamB